MTEAHYKIEQIYTPCVAQGAYFIQSKGESIVIDPLRETAPYLERVKSSGTTLKYIFETHFHADFVSGHVDLAKATKAPIVFGPTAVPGFDATIATHNQVFSVGDVTLTVLHTPGHTMESSCFLLKDEEGTPKALFSGDTLFIGDVGRPDLAQAGTGLTQEALATHLYNSLRKEVMTLPDDVVVYPAHGAGSACGKNLSSETFDSLGNQKKTNYALRADMTTEEFVEEVTAGMQPPPAYFGAAIARNKTDSGDTFDQVLANGRKKLSADDVEAMMKGKEDGSERPYVIDTRWHSMFNDAHIPGSVYAGVEGSFGPMIAAAIGDVTRPFIVIAYNDEYLTEALTRLSRFGFDSPLGHLDGGFDAWTAAKKPTAKMTCFTPDELADHINATAEADLQLVDVRKPGEYKAGHHPKATLLPLDAKNLSKVDVKKPLIVHCGSGYRSVIFISLLRFHNPEVKCQCVNVLEGFGGMKASEKLLPQLKFGTCAITGKSLAPDAPKCPNSKE